MSQLQRTSMASRIYDSVFHFEALHCAAPHHLHAPRTHGSSDASRARASRIHHHHHQVSPSHRFGSRLVVILFIAEDGGGPLQPLISIRILLFLLPTPCSSGYLSRNTSLALVFLLQLATSRDYTMSSCKDGQSSASTATAAMPLLGSSASSSINGGSTSR